MILAVDPNERQGYFFNPLPRDGRWEERLQTDWVSKLICKFGNLAKVKVADGRRKRGAAPKFASAHDLRRAFGFRWSHRVLPPVLQELMRHSDIKTTMEFYAGRHASVAAKAAHEAFQSLIANKFANNQANPEPSDTQKR